jgi:hypothetical protein
MEEHIKEIMNLIKSKVKGFILGMMGGDMRVSG